MKQAYIRPEMELIYLEKCDIICSSEIVFRVDNASITTFHIETPPVAYTNLQPGSAAQNPQE